ncbi:MAG: leucyl aminopeptidase [Deltaproteobacteria bacterium]|nr:MAG: leucyl aminopeptidase [Deltaproteobacteria bacterium]
MHITLRRTDPLNTRTACLIVGTFADRWRDPLLLELDRRLGGRLLEARRAGEFAGKANETLLLQPAAELPARRILLVGLGPHRQAGLEQLRLAAGTALGQLRGKRLNDCACALPLLDLPRTTPADRIGAVAEGLLLAGYCFDRYLTADRQPAGTLPSAVRLLAGRGAATPEEEDALAAATVLAEAVSLARDLVNEPGNVKSPAWLAEQAATAAAAAGVHCTVLDRDELAREGCGALLGVAQGSVREPRLIVLDYRGGRAGDAPVALIGKGVVFDAGGISLKPAEKMDEMKMDMAGGAAVLGACLAAARLKLPVNLVGVIPAVENLPSGSAIRPGDILTSLSGQTIEVLNTDAEGRLILADALTYARRFQPRLVVDVATLTGACIIALGHHASAVLGNDPALVQALRRAGEQTGERLWELPLWADYDQQIKSDVADVKNTGGRPAGTITAAAFLQRFAKGFRWAHLDIAGTAWIEQARPCHPKGASGVGVRLLTAFLRAEAGTAG